ncbi:hypothetical protein [Amycolatopsis sp.]|uniref:hypothetical protein n=1 Tax=Amycolatopsis sp. TaxID=37632 RepID=UPI0039C878C4
MDAEKVVFATALADVPWERTRLVNAPAADGGPRLFDDGLPPWANHDDPGD